ncbi:BTAD domain-containing putative transcriptional regulator [Lentzea sp. NPDC051208]|uniref:AfsR/SARP family transcriptional regulator n=1 Tax=Lentzea sp. NPDC051208 TaxID=3154642 RepID=UPI003417F2D6
MAIVRLLGEVGVEIDGQPVDLGAPRQRCVLAALAVDAGRVVPLDRLVERVWGTDAAPRVRATLHSYISRLRRVLPGVTIERRSGGYALLTSAVDLHQFRSLRTTADGARDDERARLLAEALGHWRGQALTGIDGEWAEAERERLAREQLTAQHDLTDVRLRLGRGGDLVVELAGRVAEHPLDERVAGQYVLALYQVGRTADALEHYRCLRERLVEELGTDPGAPLQDLHRRILAADPALSARPPATPAATAVVAPAQLPSAPGFFIGRVSQLAELDRALTVDGSGATVVISAIGGTGGIGKTWLALTWAHRNLHHFPDGQLSADLRGFSPGEPKQAADVLADFLAALGVDRDDQPSAPDARAALYRTHTTGKRMLILLDNAATPDQVVPLLPGSATCTVVVTSRNRLPALLTRHGAHPVHVDVLSDAEARALFTTALGSGALSEAVTELIALCGGFPLALGLIAARIRTHPDLLDNIVTELRELGLDMFDSDDPDTSLPAVLSWSLRSLTEQQRTVFALLGISPGPDIDLPAAISLSGLPARDVHAALRGLADASLVTPVPGGRHSMHDLVRAYAARTELPQPVRQAALDRVLDFYLHTAHSAERLLSPHNPPVQLDSPAPGALPQPLDDHRAALAWMDANHPHLLAAQHCAASDQRHQTVWQLAWPMTTFHWWRGHRHDQLAVWLAAADAAAHLHDPASSITAHRRLGQAHAALGQHEQSTEHLHQALALAERHQDRLQQALTLRSLAWAWEQRGDDRRALEQATCALDLFRALDLPTREADALSLVGWLAARLGDHDTAREHCRAALFLHHRHGHRENVASTLDSLGFIEHHSGRHHEAVENYQQALAIFRDLDDTTEIADTLDRIGHPLVALGRHAPARDAWREALELYRQQGKDDGASRVREQLDDLDGANMRYIGRG